MARPNSKESILDAAEAIVIEAGASHMTLDAVAERSGISKGGLIYNYPTKEALLEAMIGRLMERFERQREAARLEFPAGPARELLVEIRALQKMSDSDQRLGAALLAVTANQPELMERPCRTLRERYEAEFAGADRSTRMSILYFAALGLHFHDLLHLSLVDRPAQNRLFDDLLRLAGGGGEI